MLGWRGGGRDGRRRDGVGDRFEGRLAVGSGGERGRPGETVRTEVKGWVGIRTILAKER